MLDAIENEDIITVVQIAPAVRTAWGEDFGMSKEYATAQRLVAGLRRIGFDYIFDTTFAADMTIMEEGSEFLERLPGNQRVRTSNVHIMLSRMGEIRKERVP